MLLVSSMFQPRRARWKSKRRSTTPTPNHDGKLTKAEFTTSLKGGRAARADKMWLHLNLPAKDSITKTDFLAAPPDHEKGAAKPKLACRRAKLLFRSYGNSRRFYRRLSSFFVGLVAALYRLAISIGFTRKKRAKKDWMAGHDGQPYSRHRAIVRLADQPCDDERREAANGCRKGL